MKRDRQAPTLAAEVDTPELALTCSPIEVLNLVRADHGGILATKLLAVFYCFADSIGKTIEDLKAKCRPLIIARRNEGTPTGAEQQHREFVYQIPAGEVRLIVQERMVQQIDHEKLESLLKARDLWNAATSLDMEKVNSLYEAGILTAEEFSSVSRAPRATYALIAKINPGSLKSKWFPEPPSHPDDEHG